MSRLEVPIQHRTLWRTGDILLRAELELALLDQANVWKREIFRVDSGTEISSMSAARASELLLPMPQKAIPGLAVKMPHGSISTEVRAGVLRAQVVGMDGSEYVFPCFFLGDPNQPASQMLPATSPRNLLGLPGVIDKLRIIFDGTAKPGAVYGHLVIEKR